MGAGAPGTMGEGNNGKHAPAPQPKPKHQQGPLPAWRPVVRQQAAPAHNRHFGPTALCTGKTTQKQHVPLSPPLGAATG